MAYDNNHYVPQLVLRRFGNKINRYNVKTGEVKIKGRLEASFSKKNIYPEWLEHKLTYLESKFATLIDNKILKAKDMVTLTREDNVLVKKFFAIATLRVPDSSLFFKRHLDSEEHLKKKGFKEVSKENETDLDYAYRTLKVILESNSIEELYNHPEVTYEACKWFTLFFNCYLTIWDSTKSGEDFIISDNGMNCEHDKTRFLTFNFGGKSYFNERDEMLKRGYVMKKLIENKIDPLKSFLYATISQRMEYVYANYYLFAVSSTRTIALVNPFYKLYDDPSAIEVAKETPNVWPTLLSKEAMSSNTQDYKEIGKYSGDDRFNYKIKDISFEEVVIINNMIMDRVYYWMGFADSSKIIRSLIAYSLINKQFQRNNYDGLIDYLSTLGYEFPKKKKYREISEKLTRTAFTDEEMRCIELFYNLIQHHN